MLTEKATSLELTIEKPVAGGRMLARHDGQIVLVSGALPGERVRVRIEKTRRGVLFATTVRALEPSPARRKAAGDPLCGGNVFAHIAYEAQPDIKRQMLLDALQRGHVDWTGELPVAASPEHGYRMRARLHVRNGRAGFFREGTHELCDCGQTGHLLPEALDAVRLFMERTPRLVRDGIDAIEMSESIDASERVLHVHWLPGARIPHDLLPDVWSPEHLRGLTGISADDPGSGPPRAIAGQPWVSDPIDALLPPATLAVGPQPVSPSPLVARQLRPGMTRADLPPAASPAGPRPLALTAFALGPPVLRLQRHATSFFQANRHLVSELAAAVARHVGQGPVIDLYAGVGLFGFVLMGTGHKSVTAVEGDPSGARDLALNARHFPARMQVEHAPVEDYLARAAMSPEVTLVIDPPRTGLSREARERIAGTGAGRIVLVSCDLATLARDLRGLLDPPPHGGGYQLDHLEAFDLFPNTAHVETLAVLSK